MDHRSLITLLIVLLAVAVAVGATWLLWRRRNQRLLRARLARRAPGEVPCYPVVLVHGICGFDEINLFGWKRPYFTGIAQHLQAMGVEVYQTRLPPLGSVPARAARLVEIIRAIPAARVNVIAHSMGGLDTRYAIAKLGLADKIASLVTIGTPHHGTPLADLGHIGPALTVRALARGLGMPSESLDWLTPLRMVSFNQEVLDDPRVSYASVVCRAGEGLWRRNPLLVPSHAYVKQRAGTNDGLVPMSSQRWGKTLCEIQADHWAQIGWFTSDDARPIYAMIVKDLASQGL